MGAITAALIAAFIFVESRAQHPLVPLRFFRSRNVAGAVLVRSLFPVGMFGAFFLGALYLQRVLGYSPVGAGLAFMPMNLCVALFSLLVTARVVKRFGAKATLLPGLVLMTIGLLLLGLAPVNAVYVVERAARAPRDGHRCGPDLHAERAARHERRQQQRFRARVGCRQRGDPDGRGDRRRGARQHLGSRYLRPASPVVRA